jgi:hypothetical protein
MLGGLFGSLLYEYIFLDGGSKMNNLIGMYRNSDKQVL